LRENAGQTHCTPPLDRPHVKEEFASRDTLALSFPRGLGAQFAVRMEIPGVAWEAKIFFKVQNCGYAKVEP
jgi:hypothetical protein